jgi:transketolase
MGESKKILELENISKSVRHSILTSTSVAESGHPTTCLSAVELMVTLMFAGFFKYNTKNPKHVTNDRLIFSKGHAAPLLYSLWAETGRIKKKELLTLRKLGSRLDGHPTFRFPYTEAVTGSLGQGLSIGLGMALNLLYLDKLPANVFVLLGDGELSEGSIWEAAAIASFYKLKNLTAIVDVNRLEQTGQTPTGWQLDILTGRFDAFGWQTIRVTDGHDIAEIVRAYEQRFALQVDKPVAIIAKTIKGKGVSFLEDKNNWHGKVLTKNECKRAIEELGVINVNNNTEISKPEEVKTSVKTLYNRLEAITKPTLSMSSNLKFCGVQIATRKAYGIALTILGNKQSNIVVLDAGTENSTYSELFEKEVPKQFFKMFIAEQNMVGVAEGLVLSGKIPFISTFAAFLTRAHDQIRMSGLANSNIKFAGSHAGVSIGEDGASQMGLDDIAMFRGIPGSVVLYPSDAVSTSKLVEAILHHKGIAYLRLTRAETSLIYNYDEEFKVGGLKVLKKSSKDVVTIISAGITLHEALKAYNHLLAKGITARIIDLYSIKPLDIETLKKAAFETGKIITVEDHFKEGGLGEAVSAALLNTNVKIYSLCVEKPPGSGKKSELLTIAGISAEKIVARVEDICF